MLIGPHSSREQRSEFRDKILADPRNYIAQPTLMLSPLPVSWMARLNHACRSAAIRSIWREGHHRAGRAYARRSAQGSLVVNSSQGGGSKDTWVLQN